MAKPDKKTNNNDKPKASRKVKDTVSELKRVSWPTFGKVMKQTAVVFGFVLFFAVILFGIDRLLSWIYSLLV